MSKPLLQALSGETVYPPPLWLMRQAGRYLPEYQATRAKAGSFMNLALTPEYAAQVTLQPIRRFGFDAAILFSDILIVPYALGRDLEFRDGEGPRLPPLEKAEIETLTWQPERAAPVYEAVRRVKTGLEGTTTTLIGFAGSPFTVACYMVDGRGGSFERTREWAKQDPAGLSTLIHTIAENTVTYLKGQIEAGAEAIQLFDSWANLLTDPVQFEHWVTRPTKLIVEAIKADYPELPIIGFPREATPANLISYANATGVNALSLGTGVDLAWARDNLPANLTLQGNLDPMLLIEGGAALREAVKPILAMAATRPCIFNLGHGIDKSTPIAHVEELVKLVRS